MTSVARAGARRHGDQVLRALPLAVGVLGLVLSAAGTMYALRISRLLAAEFDWAGLLWWLWPMVFVVVGGVVAVARPRILVGWGLLIAGFSVQVATFSGAYAGWARVSGSSVALAELATWLGRVATGVGLLMGPLVVARLPTGRLASPMARRASRTTWIVGGALVVWWAFGNELLSINTVSGDAVGTEDLPNPLALVQTSRAVTSAITSSLTAGLLACFVWTIVLILIRRRRASVAEHAQLRWLALGLLALPMVGGVAAVADTMVTLPPSAADILFVLFLGFGLGAIPVAIAVSVLKFRLFEIDRLISRTVAFAVVALVLGSFYAVLAVLPFTLVAGVGGGDTPSWVVASTTLAAAALFSPLRKRVRRVVDRRFNRSHYDAERVAERFASQVREFTDVSAITTDLGAAVQGALQPAGVSIWVRDS